MKAVRRAIARCVVPVGLIVSCAADSEEFVLPRTLQLGESVEVLEPLLANDCRRTEKLHYTGEMAAPFRDQVQINCSGLEIFGARRDAEFMFNDGPLGHVWIHIGAEEVAELRGALQKVFGQVVYKTDIYNVFASGTAALRLNPPEVLVATPDLITELTGYRSALVSTGRVAVAGEPPAWLGPAWAKIEELSRQSPMSGPEHISRCNRYYIVDLDDDGIGEVLEHVPHYGCAGFLNSEIAPALEWVNVFGYREGRYEPVRGEFQSFYRERRLHYEHWLRQFETPTALIPDSRSLISHNRNEFVGIVREYIERLQLLR